MRTWRWYSKVLFALLVAAFAYFVWPTPWRHFTVAPAGRYALSRDMVTRASHYADGPVTFGGEDTTAAVIRVHRVTARTQVLEDNSWRDVFALPPLDEVLSEVKERPRERSGRLEPETMDQELDAVLGR